MEVLTKLSPIDLFVVVALAGGVFAGFTQGMIRSALNLVVVLVAFVIASQLRAPLFDLLGFWDAFTPPLREQILFLILFVGLVIAGFFIVRLFYRRTRLPIVRQLDELGGAVLGLLFVAVLIVFSMVVMDSFFTTSSDAVVAGAGPLKGLYDMMNDSILVQFFRDTLIPTFGALARPFVPSDIAELLKRK